MKSYWNLLVFNVLKVQHDRISWCLCFKSAFLEEQFDKPVIMFYIAPDTLEPYYKLRGQLVWACLSNYLLFLYEMGLKLGNTFHFVCCVLLWYLTDFHLGLVLLKLVPTKQYLQTIRIFVINVFFFFNRFLFGANYFADAINVITKTKQSDLH